MLPESQLHAKSMSKHSVTTLPFAIPSWVNWIAQDSSGAWWGYSVEPLRNDSGWYENEAGNYIRLGTTGSSGWENSLTRV